MYAVSTWRSLQACGEKEMPNSLAKQEEDAHFCRKRRLEGLLDSESELAAFSSSESSLSSIASDREKSMADVEDDSSDN